MQIRRFLGGIFRLAPSVVLACSITACGGPDGLTQRSNSVPTAQDLTVSLDEDTQQQITLTATDSDGQIVDFNVTSSPTRGMLSGNPPSLTYTPDADSFGPDEFRFIAVDNDGATSAEARVQITVVPVNDAPIADAQSLVIGEDESTIIVMTGTDIDSGIQSYSVVDAPDYGNLSGSGAQVTYTPNANYTGADYFTFTVTDDEGEESVAATVDITIQPMSRVTRTDYVEASGEVQNPERGFYRTIDMDDVSSVAVKQQGTWPPGMPGSGLVLAKYFLTDFCNTTTIPASQLNKLDTILDEVRDLGMKVILRIIYSNSDGTPNTCGTTDAADMVTLLGHLDQIAPKLSAHVDVIAFLEAGIFGAWGEWNDSNVPLGSGLWNDSSNRRALMDKLLETVPADRFVAVRRPRFRREHEVGNSPMTPAQSGRIGFHNDCVLASYDDAGTYDDPDNLVPGLVQYDANLDLVQNWRRYIQAETDFVPMGGETCSVSTYSSCDQAQQILAGMRFSYLNNEWHWLLAGGGVINNWENDGCYETIRQSLGFRFVVRESRYTDRIRPGGKLEIAVDIENKGYAPLHNQRPIKVILRGPDTYDVSLTHAQNRDVREWLPNATTTLFARIRLPADAAEGTYTLHLQLPDAYAGIGANGVAMSAPSYSIRFANDNLWDPLTGENMIGSVEIDQTAIGGIDPSATILTELPLP